MGDYGNVGINAGYARLNARDYGKIGLEGSLKKELDKNPNIGYTLGGNASALIGKKAGVNAGVYAGMDFGTSTCTELNLGIIGDYTKGFDKNNLKDLDSKESLKAGGSIGFTRNICCDEGRKLKMALTGGADFHSVPEINNGQIVKSNKVSPFVGSNIEYSQQINDKGHQLVFGGKCSLTKNGATYGEASIGYRF